jgi:hypothetical protein
LDLALSRIGKRLKDNASAGCESGCLLKIGQNQQIDGSFRTLRPSPQGIKPGNPGELLRTVLDSVSREDQRKEASYDPECVIPMASGDYFPVVRNSPNRTVHFRGCQMPLSSCISMEEIQVFDVKHSETRSFLMSLMLYDRRPGTS